MPSLRRTLSSPVVRSSPYPTSLSEHAAMLRAQGGGSNRRSSGAETTGRRVLADIEWWRVVDGQHTTDARDDEEEITGRDNDQNALHIAPPRIAESPQYSELDHSFVPSTTWNFMADASEAVVSAAPSTPPRNRRGREISTSSLEATPELPETVVEGIRLDLQYLDLGAHDTELPPYSMTRRDRGVAAPPFLAVRSYSVAAAISFNADSAGPYADYTISPLSSRFTEIAN